MAFLGLFKSKDEKMWDKILSQLKPETLKGMDKREFLKPSSDAMKREREFALRCCQYVESLPSNQDFMESIRKDSYASKVQKALLSPETPVSTWYDYVAERLRFWDSLTQDFLTKEQPKLTESECVTTDELTVKKIKGDFITFKENKSFLESLRKRPDWNYVPGSPEEGVAFTRALANRVFGAQTLTALQVADDLLGRAADYRGRRGKH